MSEAKANNPSIDNLRIEIINCEDQSENAVLDDLVRTVNVQHKTKYIQTLMKNLDNNFKGYFAVASADGEAVAWTYIFIDNRLAFHGLFSGAFETIYRMFPVKFKTAFISSPVAEYNVIHIKDECIGHETAIIDAMVEEILKFLKTQRVKLVIMKDHITPYPSDYLHKNFIHMHFMPGTFVDLEGVHECNHLCEAECHHGCVGFDEYLMGLKKKYRANIRNKRNRRREDLTVEVIPASSLTLEQSNRCHELYIQTRDKQRLIHERLSPSYFYECGKELCDCCKMMLAKTGDTIIGFAQLLVNEDDVINVRMGMDYEYNREYNLYYHMLYENIIYCVRKKKKRLYTSQTCYRPKMEVGAKLLPLHSYVRFHNPILQKVLGKVLAKTCQCYAELIDAEKPSEVLAKHKLSPY